MLCPWANARKTRQHSEKVGGWRGFQEEVTQIDPWLALKGSLCAVTDFSRHSFPLTYAIIITEWANTKTCTPLNTHVKSPLKAAFLLGGMTSKPRYLLLKGPRKLLNQNTTNMCIKDVKKALFKALAFQRETREVHVRITQFSSIAESRGTATWWNAKLHGMSQPCKAKATAEKTKQKQVKALTVWQARQSFHRGSICEDGLVEYGGHV